ncbi:hypothetical protein FZC80_21715 [Rossellomorea aquimaris]|uniref:Uncharacterized protein n=1 Tax=Rossellomorea aquimaris TaxID=189382 RepID=A0A5D4TAB6_9BACI|nr:hypothetical protein FZC80_21715 [Rossellomorea aquimaris]
MVVEIMIGVFIAVLLLFFSSLELWYAPDNSSLFKNFRKKLMIILPLFLLSFVLYYLFLA